MFLFQWIVQYFSLISYSRGHWKTIFYKHLYQAWCSVFLLLFHFFWQFHFVNSELDSLEAELASYVHSAKFHVHGNDFHRTNTPTKLNWIWKRFQKFYDREPSHMHSKEFLGFIFRQTNYFYDLLERWSRSKIVNFTKLKKQKLDDIQRPKPYRFSTAARNSPKSLNGDPGPQMPNLTM